MVRPILWRTTVRRFVQRRMAGRPAPAPQSMSPTVPRRC